MFNALHRGQLQLRWVRADFKPRPRKELSTIAENSSQQFNVHAISKTGDWKRILLTSAAIGGVIAATIQMIMNQRSEFKEPKTDDGMKEWRHKRIVDSATEDNPNYSDGNRLSPSEVDILVNSMYSQPMYHHIKI